MSATMTMIIYIVIIVLFFYFFLIRPQNKEKKAKEELMASAEIGDSVLTTAGFYGVIVDMNEDTVIIEFGNNKNCRIPMQKQSIVQIEKPQDAVVQKEEEKEDKVKVNDSDVKTDDGKKHWFGKKKKEDDKT